MAELAQADHRRRRHLPGRALDELHERPLGGHHLVVGGHDAALDDDLRLVVREQRGHEGVAPLVPDEDAQGAGGHQAHRAVAVLEPGHERVERAVAPRDAERPGGIGPDESVGIGERGQQEGDRAVGSDGAEDPAHARLPQLAQLVPALRDRVDEAVGLVGLDDLQEASREVVVLGADQLLDEDRVHDLVVEPGERQEGVHPHEDVLLATELEERRHGHLAELRLLGGEGAGDRDRRVGRRRLDDGLPVAEVLDGQTERVLAADLGQREHGALPLLLLARGEGRLDALHRGAVVTGHERLAGGPSHEDDLAADRGPGERLQGVPVAAPAERVDDLDLGLPVLAVLEAVGEHGDRLVVIDRRELADGLEPLTGVEVAELLRQLLELPRARRLGLARPGREQRKQQQHRQGGEPTIHGSLLQLHIVTQGFAPGRALRDRVPPPCKRVPEPSGFA
jgi:hypothetical protein